MKTVKYALYISLLLILSVVIVGAQDGTCPEIVNGVVARVENVCSGAERNQACYGNSAISVVEREAIQFANVGDIANVSAIESLRLSPLDESSEAWGVAVMRLQTNLPDTLPGQNVTFLLFGDVELTNAVSDSNTSATPMQAFYLSTGVNSTTDCAEAPESGLLVQTPEGVGEVAFSVNGVDISLGSTAFLQAQPNGNMSVSALEGAAYTSYDGEDYPVVAGTLLNIPLGEDLIPEGIPDVLASYDLDFLDDLPIELLERDFEIEIPLTEDELDTILERIEDGVSVCGEESFLPSCDHIPFRFGGEACWLDDDGAFDCESDRDLFWGEDGFGEFEFENLWEDFEFDFEAIGLDNLLDEYGIDSVDDLGEGFEDSSPEELETYFDDMGLEPLEDLEFDLDLDLDLDLDFADEGLEPLDDLEFDLDLDLDLDFTGFGFGNEVLGDEEE